MPRRSRVALSALVLLATCCHQGAVLRKQTRLMMDTYVSISVLAPAARVDKATADAFERLEEISRKFNHLDSASPVFAFNNRNETLTDPEIVGVIKEAQALSEASGGAFDITVEPLVRLWGFYSGDYAVPSQRAIDSCLKLVGFRKLSVEHGRVAKLDPRVTIDLGGITKGYALAEAARVLKADGIESAIVDAGGDVYAVGRKGGENWRVGVRNPRGEGILGVAAVSNLAVVTSGDYERFFLGPDSTRYCHIIDPRSGWPARGAVSATVITGDPVMAPAWSKVLFILGLGAASAARPNGLEALLVTDDLEMVRTDGLTSIMRLESERATSESSVKRSRR